MDKGVWNHMYEFLTMKKKPVTYNRVVYLMVIPA